MFLGAIAGAIGSVVSGMGQAKAQQAQADEKKAEALDQRMQGTAEQGAKTYEALDADKEREQVTSNQRARFAASGGGVDGTAKYVMDKTNQRGAFKRDMVIWQGKSMKRQREVNAMQLERESEALESAAKMSQLSGIVNGISGVAGAFGGFGSQRQENTAPSNLYYG